MSRLLVGGEMLLYGEVGDPWGDGFGFNAKEVITALATLNGGDIVVRINSGGGSVWEGVAIYNALKQHKGNVITVVDALAASAASVIALAGDERLIGTGAMFMIHEPHSSTWSGDAEDHENAAKLLESIASTMADIYAEHTGMSAKKIRELMIAETWMTADEAVKMGFATRLLSDEDEEEEMTTKNSPTAEQPGDKVVMENSEESDPKAEFPPKEDDEDEEDEDKEKEAKASASDEDEEDDEDEEEKAQAPAQVAARSRVSPPMSDYSRYRNPPAHIAAAQRDLGERSKKKDTTKMTKTKDEAPLHKQIYLRCRQAKLSDDQIDDIMAKADSMAKAKDLIIEALSAQAPEAVTGGAMKPAGDLKDGRDKAAKGMELALLARCGMKGGERNEFTAMTLREMARACLVNMGVPVNRINDPMTLASAALNPRAFGYSFTPRMESGFHSTSDFTEICGNIANKSMMIGFEELDENFAAWTSKGTLTDFKVATRIDAGLFPNLSEIPEGAEYTYATLSDRKVTVQLATYGKMFSITRQGIINDDLNMFSKVPQKMGRASKRTIGNLVWAQITGNVALDDGVALFHGDHDNWLDAGTALSVSSLDAARAAMMRQTDPDSVAETGLNIRPAFLLVAPEYEGTAKVLMSAQYVPESSKFQIPNHVAGMAQVVSDARLSGAAWYLVAAPNSTDTIEVSYLNGVETPVMEQRDGWSVDGVEFKIRIDAGVKVLDHRGFYKNDGP